MACPVDKLLDAANGGKISKKNTDSFINMMISKNHHNCESLCVNGKVSS